MEASSGVAAGVYSGAMPDTLPPIELVLEEDMQTAWVPHVLGLRSGADFDAEPGTSGERIEEMHVPKPDGSRLVAPILPLDRILQLHDAAEPFKDFVDHSLEVGVCGYRRGAESGMTYRTEHRRFTEFVEGETERAAFVVSADIRQFFVSTNWDLVLEAARTIPGVSTARLEDVARDFRSLGLDHLPAGYADARFLANMVLLQVDATLRLPFARWVDDYRIFAASEADALEAVRQLSNALETIGLRLNADKVHIQPMQLFRASRQATLTSVYHPDSEPTEQVRASLRSVFISASSDPVAHRRELRFVLPRLAAEGDNIAVEWALAVLRDVPWEAPRIVDYLYTFSDDVRVRRGLENRLIESLDEGHTWVSCRLAVGLFNKDLSRGAAHAVAGALHATESPSLWGLLLRLLAFNGYAQEATEEIAKRCLSQNAVIAARMDMEVRGADNTHLAAAPPPNPHSIL